MTQLVDHLVYRLRYGVIIVPKEVIGYRLAIKLTPRLLQPLRQFVCFCKHFIRYRNRGLHTKSITGGGETNNSGFRGTAARVVALLTPA